MGEPRPTRDRILAAALSAFAEAGYQATSLDALATDLGVRKQTILYWFASKDALLAAVIDEAGAAVGNALGDAHDPAAALDAALRLGTARPELLALVREVVRLGPPASERLAATLAPLVARAGRAAEPGAVLRAAAMIVGMATEVEVLRAAGAEPDLAWLRRRRRAILAELDGRTPANHRLNWAEIWW